MNIRFAGARLPICVQHSGDFVTAHVYGPVPAGMGSFDEHVEVEEFLGAARTHALSAYDYLSRG